MLESKITAKTIALIIGSLLSGAVQKVLSLIHVTFACIKTRDPFLII